MFGFSKKIRRQDGRRVNENTVFSMIGGGVLPKEIAKLTGGNEDTIRHIYMNEVYLCHPVLR
ncbi:MAG: hypothetical protein II798_05420 [Lachnospiraceae bacterium]|jgi:hypothetical protein|nr:hypothetical protein [Lachnospiraceae bacterium]MBR1848942.1 hypothetical protein [Lachnospiraceae bacterium]